MTNEERLDILEKQVKELSEFRRIGRGGYAPASVAQQDIDGVILFFGLEADLPDDGSTEIKAYYATDTDTLYLWDGLVWQSH